MNSGSCLDGAVMNARAWMNTVTAEPNITLTTLHHVIMRLRQRKTWLTALFDVHFTFRFSRGSEVGKDGDIAVLIHMQSTDPGFSIVTLFIPPILISICYIALVWGGLWPLSCNSIDLSVYNWIFFPFPWQRYRLYSARYIYSHRHFFSVQNKILLLLPAQNVTWLFYIDKT